MEDQGSQSQGAEVLLQGFPAVGIADIGTDIIHKWSLIEESGESSSSTSERLSFRTGEWNWVFGLENKPCTPPSI